MNQFGKAVLVPTAQIEGQLDLEGFCQVGIVGVGVDYGQEGEGFLEELEWVWGLGV